MSWIDGTAGLDRRHLWDASGERPGWADEEPLVIERGEGTDLIDDRGRRYIDGVASLGANVHGHRHPAIEAAIRAQLDRLAHSTALGLTHPGAAELADRLAAIAPPGLDRVFLSDSGSAAVETALKLALAYWQRRGEPERTSFVTLGGAYHGETLGAVSVGGIDRLHGAYGPLLFKTRRVDPGDTKRLERVLDLHHRDTAAVIVEPLVQAAGIRVQPPGFLRRARELTEEYGVLLIADEAATGLGRTGTMFACEAERVAPDFLCLGNALTGGYLPLAATLTTERVYAGFHGADEESRASLHGPTSTGNPLACAAALASLELFEREDTMVRLQPKIRLLGELLDGVAAMPEVAEVRGRGFMVGIDLGEHDPALRLGHRVAHEARERGAVVRPLGETVALTPPLSISQADLERLVEITAEAIRAAVGAHGRADVAAADLRAAA